MKNEPNQIFVKTYRESNQDVQIAVHRDFDQLFHLYAKTQWVGFYGLIPGFSNPVKNEPVVSEKSKFQFSYVNDLG